MTLSKDALLEYLKWCDKKIQRQDNELAIMREENTVLKAQLSVLREGVDLLTKDMEDENTDACNRR